MEEHEGIRKGERWVDGVEEGLVNAICGAALNKSYIRNEGSKIGRMKEEKELR